MQNTYINGVDIKVEPFDLSYSGETNKLDLLYYNNINRYGEILTSLVYNSGVRAVKDTTLIVYNPNMLFLNTAFEKSYSQIESGNRWCNLDLLTNGIKNLKDNSAQATYTYPRFNVSTDYAVPYKNGDHMYDGWYTLCSVALRSTVTPTLLGTLRDNAGVAQYYSATGIWTDLNQIKNSVDIYNFLRVNKGEIYLTYDFVSTIKINSLNKVLLDNKLDSYWFKRVNILNPKLRTLETAVEFNKYDLAQHMINSVSNSLLSLLI